MSGPLYAGLPTFFRLPYVETEDELERSRPHVAILGAPWDDSVTYRPGARFGPRAVRQAMYLRSFFHVGLQLDPFQHLRVVDFGDAACVPSLVEPSHAAIRDKVAQAASRGIIPLVVGGDHSVTFPAATAVAEAVAPRRLGVVHFDAHADTATDAWGNLWSHGTPMRRLIESGAVEGRNFVQIGLRGYWPPPEVWDWMAGQGMRWHTMAEIEEGGFEAVLRRGIEEALDGPEVIYLSVDIDVVDPGSAPGTGTPEPGGLAPVDLLRAIRLVAMETELVGMDLTEVSPPYDPAEVTATLANRCLLEALSGLATRRA
ncbi:MAG: agmatinase family protein [Acidimicrobiia bacterium]